MSSTTTGIKPGHVYIASRFHADVILTFDVGQDCSQPTMRRGATTTTSVLLPKNMVIDVTARFGLDHEAALKLALAVPELKRPGVLLDVIDGNSSEFTFPLTRPDPLTTQTAPTETYVTMGIVTPRFPIEQVQIPMSKLYHGQEVPPQPTETPATRYQVLARQEEKGLPATVATPVGSPPPLTAEQVAAKAREELENQPSIAWSRERLVSRARERGIEVTPNMQKAAILRKLRGIV